MVNYFPKRRLLVASKLKEFADENFRFNKIADSSRKGLENTVGKGGIARYEQCLLFPPCFQKTCTADSWKKRPAWETIKRLPTTCRRQLSCILLPCFIADLFVV